MNNNRDGRSVRLFLVDGNPTGLVTAEIINWSGHILTGSRSGLSRFLAREELDRTGIYLLFGHSSTEPDLPLIYIGESDNVRKRLAQHNKDQSKDFWEKTCVVTSKDQNITKAHARYLEARLISITAEIGKAKLVNSTAHSPQTLPEADTSDMEYFIEQIRLALPLVGFDTLKSKPKRSHAELTGSTNPSQEMENPIFVIQNSKLNLLARAQEAEGEFIVLKDSSATHVWRGKRGHNTGYAKLHDQLVATGKLAIVPNSKTATFTEDIAFSSPSAASAIVYGRADNGRTSWKVESSGKSYASWQEDSVEQLQTGE